jgi:hypothetical protein
MPRARAGRPTIAAVEVEVGLGMVEPKRLPRAAVWARGLFFFCAAKLTSSAGLTKFARQFSACSAAPLHTVTARKPHSKRSIQAEIGLLFFSSGKIPSVERVNSSVALKAGTQV